MPQIRYLKFEALPGWPPEDEFVAEVAFANGYTAHVYFPRSERALRSYTIWLTDAEGRDLDDPRLRLSDGESLQEEAADALLEKIEALPPRGAKP